jgi:GTP1/Obg family GTP-binding protein
MAIAWDQVIIENTLLAVIIVASIYFERWLGDKAHRRKERKTKKSTIKFIINDLENKLRFIEESRQYKDYKPFFTDMWDAIILTGRHSLLSFEIFEDLQHTYSWMKYYNTELDVNKSDEGVLKDLLNEVTKSIDQSLKNLAIADK